jgi:bacterioferritin (cytochrome b1)
MGMPSNLEWVRKKAAMAAKSNGTSAQLIPQLNKILSLEYAGVVQYMQHSCLVSGHDRMVFADFFRDQSKASLKHASVLGDKIVALGGVPTNNSSGQRSQ